MNIKCIGVPNCNHNNDESFIKLYFYSVQVKGDSSFAKHKSNLFAFVNNYNPRVIKPHELDDLYVKFNPEKSKPHLPVKNVVGKYTNFIVSTAK